MRLSRGPIRVAGSILTARQSLHNRQRWPRCAALYRQPAPRISSRTLHLTYWHGSRPDRIGDWAYRVELPSPRHRANRSDRTQTYKRFHTGRECGILYRRGDLVPAGENSQGRI